MIKQLPFWFLTIAVFVALILSQLVQDGMFMDGLLYVSVSKNLADGIGTFWHPHFSPTQMSSFHEQPPLYFGLLALFYKLFGTSLYVERLFCFLCYIVTAFYIHKLWRKVFNNQTAVAENSWLPVLFFTIIPVCFWAYSNHVEETVMAMFVVISVYYAYVALSFNEHVIYNLIISGIFVFLSSLTKGIQGLFPIVCVGAYWITHRSISFKKMIFYSMVPVLVIASMYGFLLLTNDEVYSSFQQYYYRRLETTFNNRGATVDNRLDLLLRLFMELLPIMCLSVILLFFSRKHRSGDLLQPDHYRTISWFLLIGLSGSLPLMITLEQRGFYLVTALPFFAIAISAWIGPRVTVLTNKIKTASGNFKVFKIFSMILLLSTIVFTFTQVGKTKRDKELLDDIYAFGKIIPHGEIVSIPDVMFDHWSLKEYLVRYFYISCDHSGNKNNYYLLRKDLPVSTVPEGYERYPLETKYMDLYQVKK